MALLSICQDVQNHHPKEECDPHISVRPYPKKKSDRKEQKDKNVLEQQKGDTASLAANMGLLAKEKPVHGKKLKPMAKVMDPIRERLKGR